MLTFDQQNCKFSNLLKHPDISLQSPVRFVTTHQLHQADGNTKMKGNYFYQTS